MTVKYTGGGGGLFSSFLPSLLQLGGAALGGPVGAGIGGALGSAINGGSVGDVIQSGVGGYLGRGGQIGQVNAPVFNPSQAWNQSAMQNGGMMWGQGWPSNGWRL